MLDQRMPGEQRHRRAAADQGRRSVARGRARHRGARRAHGRRGHAGAAPTTTSPSRSTSTRSCSSCGAPSRSALLEREVLCLRSALAEGAPAAPRGFDGMVGRHPGDGPDLRADRADRARRRPPCSSPGESGTGKELVARAIHHQSDRAHAAVRGRQLAAHPRDALETELFGHEKGAFTGAHAAQARARSSWPTAAPCSSTRSASCALDLQAKLLRVLQEREIERARRRAGRCRSTCASSPRPTATSRQAVRERAFREDLTTGSTWCPLHLPPLRERRDDIPRLVRSLRRARSRASRSRDVRGVSAGALDALVALRLAGQRARAGERDRARGRALARPRHPAAGRPAGRRDAGDGSRLDEDTAASPLRDACDHFERQYVLRVLERVHWNVSARRGCSACTATPSSRSCRRGGCTPRQREPRAGARSALWGGAAAPHSPSTPGAPAERPRASARIAHRPILPAG